MLQLILIAIGLSMDAFAVSVCAGLTMRKVTFKKALVFGIYFGIFQAIMPLIGYYLSSGFADKIKAFDHWIAFALLAFIGIKMIIESFKKNTADDRTQEEPSLKFTKMLPLAIATSIDALAAGISFSLLEIDIIPAVSLIGAITFAFSMAGTKIGNIFGLKFKSGAELIGGIILVAIGIKILIEHLSL